MGVIEDVAVATGLSAPALRLLVALLLCYPLAFLYRFVPAKSHTLKHVFCAVSGMFLAYFNFGTHILHSFLSILFTWLTLKLVPNRQISAAIVFVAIFGHLLVSYLVYSSVEAYDIDFTTPQCVLTLRLISLALDYYDGSKPDAKTDQKLNGLKQLPTILEVFGFSYFFAAFLTGPQFTFRHYKEFITLELFEQKPSESSAQAKPSKVSAATLANTIPVGPMLKCVVLGAVYLGINTVGDMLIPTSYIIDPAFVSQHNLAYRLVYMTVSLKSMLWRYLGVWMLAEGACILSGIGFGGFDEKGNPQWDGVSNVHPWLYETTPTLNGIVASFNVNTNDWSKRYIFKRLIFLNNRTLSSLGTLFFLALWHGFAPGFFTCFFMEFLDMEVEGRYRSLGWWDMMAKKIPPLVPVATVLLWIARNFALSYGVLSLNFKTWELSMRAYASVLHLNLILCIVFLMLHPLIAPLFKKKKAP